MQKWLSAVAVIVALIALGSSASVVTSGSPDVLWTAGIEGLNPKDISVGIPEATNDAVFTVFQYTHTLFKKTVHFITAVDAQSGNMKWAVEAHGAAQYATVGEDLLFVSSENYLTAHKASTGAVQWKYANKDLPRLSCANGWPGKPTFINANVSYNGLKKAVVMVTWYNTPAVVLDAATGALLQQTTFTVGGRIWYSSQSDVTFTTVICQKEDIPSPSLYSISKFDLKTLFASVNSTHTGGLLWSTVSPDNGWTNAAADAFAIASKGPAFPDTNDQATFRIVNPNNGKVQFLLNTSTAGWDFNVAEERVFKMYPADLKTNTTTIRSFDVKGKMLWENTKLPYTQGFNCYAGGKHIVLQGETVNVAIDATNGRVLWSLASGAPAYGASSPDGSVYYFGQVNVNGTVPASVVAVKF